MEDGGRERWGGRAGAPGGRAWEGSRRSRAIVSVIRGVRGRTHRHVPQEVRGLHPGRGHELALALVELARDVGEVVRGEVRALEEGVERVHPAEQAHLFLVVQERRHRGRAPRGTRLRGRDEDIP